MNVDELLTRTLERHATEAPPATNLADRARTALRARRQRRAVVLSVASVVAAVAVTLSVLQLPAPLPPADGPLPPGWRWESYRGIQIQVPSSWGYGASGWPWCLDQGVRKAYVGRPGGGIPLVGCVGDKPPASPHRAAYLWFDTTRSDLGVDRFDHGWVRETRTVAGVVITVFTDDARLRRRILDTAQPVKNVDANGCPIRQSFSRGVDAPRLPGLADARSIRSVSICSYGPQAKSGVVVASTRLPEESARKLAAAILDAPEGTGPNAPRGNACSDSGIIPPGKVLLIRFHTSIGDVDVQVSIDECAGRWARDPQTYRKLTNDLMQRAFTGPHRITEYDESLAPLVPN